MKKKDNKIKNDIPKIVVPPGPGETIELIRYIRTLTEEQAKKYCDADTYRNIINSKEGDIRIEKVSPVLGPEEWGYTPAFGEGLSCHMDNPHRWYHTSVIQKIDWEKHEFTTLNSVYKFTFKESKEE